MQHASDPSSTPKAKILGEPITPRPPASMTYSDGKSIDASIVEVLSTLAGDAAARGYGVETFRHEAALVLARRAYAYGLDCGIPLPRPTAEQLAAVAEAERLGIDLGATAERERLGREVAAIGVVVWYRAHGDDQVQNPARRGEVIRHATDDHREIRVRDDATGAEVGLLPGDLGATWGIARWRADKIDRVRPVARAMPTAGRRAKPKTRAKPKARKR